MQEGIRSVRASHDLSRVSVSFDEPNLVPSAGLLPAAVLAQRIDLSGLVEARVRLARHGANSGAKALTVIGSMLAGGDSIDDTALLRTGALPALFDVTRAPSTVGTWLRDFKWHNVRQLDAVSRELLVRLWAAGAGPADLGAAMTIDVDSTIVAVFGRGKQGAAFGYTKVRGYHPQLATCAETGQVLFSRLRGGSAGAARGAKSFLTETFSRVRAAGATGELTLRADSAFYSKAVLATAAKFGVRFSVTARQDKRVRAAIEAIDEAAWTPIPYWLSTPEVSGADVAETDYTCFAGTRDARTVRLIVRRVRPTPGSQLALFTTYDYHAFVTDRHGPMLEIEADHRRHAIVEQSIAELKSAGLAHLPSSRFMANAAWLALTAMAHNIARSVGLLAGGVLHRATTATLQRAVFTIPGRLVRSARRWRLRLPASWPWANQFDVALDAITAIPARC
jgi:Transposase DDE domain group 1